MKIKLLWNSKDISSYVSSITWSGSKSEVARKVELKLIGQLSIDCGDNILFYNDGQEVFRGRVFIKDKTQSEKMISITAYDSLVYLLESHGTYNFKKITPEGITQKVCSDFNIPTNNLASSGVNCNLLFNDKSIYNIIMTAYTKAENSTGKQYIPIMQYGKLNVIIKGAKVVSYNNSYITETQNTESIENMINRIKAYDEKNKFIGFIENTQWVKQYGILQAVETSDKKNLSSLRGKLNGIEKTVSMNGLGDINCITGNAIKIKVTNGISGLFFIDDDSHTWQDGNYTMQLTLNYQNLMDEQADNENEEESPTVKGSNKKAKRKGKLSAKKAAKKAAKAKAAAQAAKDALAAIKEYGG